jgi:hypothetical protein
MIAAEKAEAGPGKSALPYAVQTWGSHEWLNDRVQSVQSNSPSVDCRLQRLLG